MKRISQMGNAFGYVKLFTMPEFEKKICLAEIWLAPQNVTTRVSLLFHSADVITEHPQMFTTPPCS